MSRGFGKDRIARGRQRGAHQLPNMALRSSAACSREGPDFVSSLRCGPRPSPTMQESQTRHCVHGVP